MNSIRRQDVVRGALLAALALGTAGSTGCGGDRETAETATATENARASDDASAPDAPARLGSGASEANLRPGDAADARASRTSTDDDVTTGDRSVENRGPGEPSAADDGAPDTAASEASEGAPDAPRTPADVLPEPAATAAADITAGASVPVAPQLSPDAATALAAAKALRKAGDRMGAVRSLRAAEKALGDNATLRLEAAWCFFELAEKAFAQDADKFLVKGNLADAHLRLDQATAMHAELPTATVLFAKLLRYEEDPKRARNVLTEHLTRFPGDAAAHFELGDMARNARDWAAADSQFTKAAELDPADGRSRLAATTAKQWLTAEGAASYTRAQFHAGYRTAARLLPDEDDPIRLLVGLYPNARSDRLAALNDVIDDNPRAVWARVWKAYVLRQGDDADPKAALDTLEEARRIEPTNAAVLVNRAETLAQMESWNDAVAAYTDVLTNGEIGTLASASNDLERLLHIGAQSANVPIAARDRAYDALCAANPQLGRFGNNAGLWYRDVGHDYEKSLKYYQKAVDAQPEDQDYINDTALIYLFHLRDRKEVSLPMFLKVVALVEDEGQEPVRGYWDALENLCKYYFEIGQYKRVLECAEKRADGRANVGGRAYPSIRAAQYANQARRKLAETK